MTQGSASQCLTRGLAELQGYLINFRKIIKEERHRKRIEALTKIKEMISKVRDNSPTMNDRKGIGAGMGCLKNITKLEMYKS